MKSFGIVLLAALEISLFLSADANVSAQVTLATVGSTNVGVAEGLKVAGHYAYLANGSTGLHVIDVTDATHPVSIATSASMSFSRDLDISGDLVYLVDGSGLNVYDVSNPAAPVRISTNVFSGFPNSIVVSNNEAYLGNPGLSVYDVSDPTNTRRTGQTNSNPTFQVVQSGHYIYETAPNTAHSLYVYDVINPSAPTNVFIGPGTYVFGIAVSGNYLFAAATSFQPAPGQFKAGLVTFDISNRTNPVYLSCASNSMGSGAHVVVSGQYVYLIDYLYGLRVFDVSNPTNLIKVGTLTGLGTAYDLQVSGPYAYVASNDGLRVVEIMPQLSSSLTATNTLVLSWPATSAFSVQTNSDLASPGWVTLGDAPITIGAKSQLILSRPVANTFYRLISQ